MLVITPDEQSLPDIVEHIPDDSNGIPYQMPIPVVDPSLVDFVFTAEKQEGNKWRLVEKAGRYFR